MELREERADTVGGFTARDWTNLKLTPTSQLSRVRPSCGGLEPLANGDLKRDMQEQAWGWGWG